ncbi:hypothetical protein [Leuconostoc kimchii]|uniref:Uncharacterized protein n=1 Tax=Leuconostoc kimchii TaxID=136609 RepID=A0ABX5SL50_9LACO|nr:hypothetical protein [Leuconostoc kimchii]QBR48091.1 hypothetical protein EW139_08105 [Leuconostoc kimchii]
MNEFEITIPNNKSLIVDVTNKTLYNYDFGSYSLAPLQKAAGITIGEKIKKELIANVSKAELLQKSGSKNNVEYVAKFTNEAREKLKTGEWSLGVKKDTNDLFGIIKETKTGKNKSIITLDAKTVDKLGNLTELSAIQGQLTEITEQIEGLNRLIERIEQGQYNDRFAGFFSARQLVIEALASNNNDLKKDLLISAVKTNNDTIAKLMFTIRQDADAFIDMKTKAKDAKRIDDFLQNSIGYLNASIQLNLVAYTAMGEKMPLMATLVNYQSFIEQTLLKQIGDSEKSVSWKIDNMHQGTEGKFNKIAQNVSGKITSLVHNMEKLKIGELTNDSIG